MKTVEEMILRVRRETRNRTGGFTTAGNSIEDAEFVDALQDAQELCTEAISGVFSKLFWKTKIYTIDTSVIGYEELAIPSDMLLNSRIVSVEYSPNGSASNYMVIPPRDARERYSGKTCGYGIDGYMKLGSQIILTPMPSQSGAKIRLIYEATPLRLDVIKATVTDAGGILPETLVLEYDTTSASSDILNYWDIGDLVNVIDRRTKDIIIQNALVYNLNTDEGTLRLDYSNATLIGTDADWEATDMRLIESGRTNTSTLPDLCEKYLVSYAIYTILDRDASKLASRAETKFNRIADSLIKSYLSEDKDWPAIPETRY